MKVKMIIGFVVVLVICASLLTMHVSGVTRVAYMADQLQEFAETEKEPPKIVATVNGEAIYSDLFKQTLGVKRVSNPEVSEDEVLDSIVKDYVIRQYASELNLGLSEEEENNLMTYQEDIYSSQEDTNDQSLIDLGISKEAYIQYMTNQAINTQTRARVLTYVMDNMGVIPMSDSMKGVYNRILTEEDTDIQTLVDLNTEFFDCYVNELIQKAEIVIYE